VVRDPIKIEDLFPSAVDLFCGQTVRRCRDRLPLLAWVIADALAALVGRHLLSGVDHNV